MPTAAVRPTNAAVARWSMIPRRVRRVVLSQLQKFDQRLLGLSAGSVVVFCMLLTRWPGRPTSVAWGAAWLEQRVLVK